MLGSRQIRTYEGTERLHCSASLSRVRLRDVHPYRAMALMLSAWTLVLLGAVPATASCSTDSPEPSPHALLGTVIGTSAGGRVAEVVTDDGATVTVQGTEGTSWFSNSYSSVDRRFALGGRYEFHPTNDHSPYSDNACTATRQVSGPPLSALSEPEVREGVLPEWLPVDDQAGPLGYLIFFGPISVGALALFTVLRRVRGRRRTAPSGS